MEKAYNRLNWDFIKKCSTDLCFPDKWLNWTIQCIIIPSFRVIVNGE